MGINNKYQRYQRVNVSLYLPLDIDNPVSLGFGLFRKCSSLAGEQPHGLIFLLECTLRSVVQDKADALLVGLETKFFGNKADIYVGFVPRQLVG